MIMFTTSFWANYNNSPTRNKALLDFIAIFPPSEKYELVSWDDDIP